MYSRTSRRFVAISENLADTSNVAQLQTLLHFALEEVSVVKRSNHFAESAW